jgi:hypothetical protein
MLNTKFYRVAKIVCAVLCAASPLVMLAVINESMSDNMFWSCVLMTAFIAATSAYMCKYFNDQQHMCEQRDNDMQRRREARRNRMENR